MRAYLLSQGERAMTYGHAERNLALIRQLEAETRKLLGSLDQLDLEQSAWLREVTRPGRQAVHQDRGRNNNGVSSIFFLIVRVLAGSAPSSLSASTHAKAVSRLGRRPHQEARPYKQRRHDGHT
jgi:hypothetical protein